MEYVRNKVAIMGDTPDLERTRDVSRDGEIGAEQDLAFMSTDVRGRRWKYTKFEIAALNKTKRASVFGRVGKRNLIYGWDEPSWALRSMEFTPVRDVRTYTNSLTGLHSITLKIHRDYQFVLSRSRGEPYTFSTSHRRHSERGIQKMIQCIALPDRSLP